MTGLQEERLRELENQAVDLYLDKTDFNVTDYLEDEEQIEFCKLYNMQFEEKNCRCGTHENWQ